MRVRSAWLACAVVVALAGCATRAPVRDNAPGSAPVAGTDEDELWYAMERAETELKRSPLRVRDPALNTYISEVGCKAAGAHCRDLRIYVMDEPQFNASMAPNGMMLFWTGALLRIRDEAELAFVLGHEAGHFTAQHSLRQWRRMKDASAVMGAFQVSEDGDLANWRLPDRRGGAIGGAADLAVGSRRVWVMTTHSTKDGEPKLVKSVTYPLTGRRVVTRIYTELAVLDVVAGGLRAVDLAPGVTPEELIRRTAAAVEIAIPDAAPR